MASQKLTKSTTNRMIAGVCGGIGEYLDMDPTIVRVLYVVISLLSAAFPGLIVYIALALILPER